MNSFLLFADVPAAATRTDKEVMIAVGSAVAAVIPILAAVIHVMTRWYRDRAKKAEAALGAFTKQMAVGPLRWQPPTHPKSLSATLTACKADSSPATDVK